ncbi:MAG: DUF5916 domain-containing protein [Bacteroidota bacterium]
MKKLLFFYCLLLFSFYSYAQKSITASRVTHSPLVDGIIDNSYYTAADSAVDFVQLEPQKGMAASRRTVVYFMYDSLKIYVAFKCFQEAESVVSRIQTRDQLSKSDDVALLQIDTYNDNRTAYAFMLNPLGSQTDFVITDDGRTTDVNWDTKWESAAKVHERYWVAEFSIPFNSFNYKKGSTNWGINFGRIIRENFETAYWSGSMTQDFRISESGMLINIQTPRRKTSLMLFPYGTMRYENNDFTETYDKFTPNIGGDIRLQIGSSASADITINPDFATVEADQEKINLTRYELSYPEKRIFFLEGNEMYRTRIRTFYSRRIEDIAFGGKTSGKLGPYSFNLLSVRSLEIEEDSMPPAFFTAARVKRDVLKSSFVGLTYADKTWKDGYARSISGDYLFNLGEKWKLTGQFVTSFPGDFRSSSAFFVRFARENNIYHYHIRFTSIGDKFMDNVNQTGFIRDDDRLELDGDVEYKWWLQNNIFEYIEVVSANNVFWSQKGVLRSWYVTEFVNFYFRNKFNITYAYNNEYKLFEKDYFNHRHSFSLGYNTDEWSNARAGYTFGRNFDRDFYLITGEVNFKVSDKLSFELSSDYVNFTPDTTNSSTLINVVAAQYYFTKDIWVKVFAQNSTNIERIYIYGLFGWRFKPPFGAVYLIYTRDQMQAALNGGTDQADIFFIKLTYPIKVW